MSGYLALAVDGRSSIPLLVGFLRMCTIRCVYTMLCCVSVSGGLGWERVCVRGAIKGGNES